MKRRTRIINCIHLRRWRHMDIMPVMRSFQMKKSIVVKGGIPDWDTR